MKNRKHTAIRGITAFSLLLLLSGFSAVLSPAKAQNSTSCRYDDPASEFEHKVILLNHLTAEISIDTISKRVDGYAEFLYTTLNPSFDSVVLYAPGIIPVYASVNDSMAVTRIAGSNIVIKSSNHHWQKQPGKLVIKYFSISPAELHFVGWDDTTRRMRRQIWAHRPFGWIPFQNDRLTIDLKVKFSGTYQVYSNGERIAAASNSGNYKTWHYRMSKPHPFFSTALVIGHYSYRNFTTKAGTPLEYWYYPDQEDHFEPTYRYSVEMFNFLEKELGIRYPWALYRQAPVADYLYGAMETTTATIFGDYMHIDERGWWGRNYVNVNVHELTHQWFGNYIAHEPASDVWLTESLATYYAKLFEKSIFGNDYYEKEKLSEQRKALAQAEINDLPLSHSQAGVARWYQKGSLVLDMLREETGDSLFRKAMTHYLRKHAYGQAGSHDFIRAFYEATGLPLNWFFNQWLFSGGEPHFEVSYHDTTISHQQFIVLIVKQIQQQNCQTDFFRVKVPVTIGYTDGSTTDHMIRLDSRDTSLRIPAPPDKTVSYIVFDSGNHLLKRLSFERTPQQLAAAATGAPLAIDRFEALSALREISVDLKRDALLKAAGLAENELIYTEVLFQLKADSSEAARNFFHGALRHPDALIRRSAVTNYSLRTPADTSRLTHLLSDPDYINVELALRKLCSYLPSEAEYWLSLTQQETGWRGKNIRIAWLEISARLHGNIPSAELLNYVSGAYEFETRINAINALSQLNYIDPNHAVNLIRAAKHWNPKLSRPAIEAIRNYCLVPGNQQLISAALISENTSFGELGME